MAFRAEGYYKPKHRGTNCCLRVGIERSADRGQGTAAGERLEQGKLAGLWNAVNALQRKGDDFIGKVGTAADF